MWQALLGSVITDIVKMEMTKRFGPPAQAAGNEAAAKQLAYQAADKTLTDIRDQIKAAPDKAVSMVEDARAMLKVFMAAQ